MRLKSCANRKKSKEEGGEEQAPAAAAAAEQGAQTDRKEGGDRGGNMPAISPGANMRKGVRQENDVGIISEQMPPPWDAILPPDDDQLEHIFEDLGMGGDEILMAQGCADSEPEEESGDEEEVVALERRDWMVSGNGKQPLQFNFRAMMETEAVLMPEPPLLWSFEEEDLDGEEADLELWEDFFTPLPDASYIQRIQKKVLEKCEIYRKRGENFMKKYAIKDGGLEDLLVESPKRIP